MLSVTGVKLYKKYISRDFNGRSGSSCAYHSSCSTYVKDVLEHDGISGAMKGLARLQKCTPGNNSLRISKLLKYAANCPESRLDGFFHFSDATTKERFMSFRRQLLESAHHLAKGHDAQGVSRYDSAIKNFLSEVHFTVADPADPTTPTIPFHLHPRRKPQDIVKADRGAVANSLRSGAALAGAGVGALVGGIAGLVTGAAIGATDGFTAGLGLDPVRRQQRLKKYGEGAQLGNEKTREKAAQLHQKLQQSLGLEVVSNLVGGTFGLIHGLFSGGFRMASNLGKMGRDMGAILARNVSDELLGKVFDSRGELVVEAAHHHHHHSSKTEKAADPAQLKLKAESLWSVLSQAPHEFRPAGPAPKSKQNWQFAVFSDATPNDLESQEIRRVVEFERQLSSGSRARIHVRRDGLISPRFRGLLRVGKFVASAASLVALSAGGIGLSLAPSLLLRSASLASGISALKEAFRDSQTHDEAFWTGRHVYSLDGPVQEKSEKIQTTPAEKHRAVSAVSVGKLSSDLQASFTGAGPRVALFAGHGNSYDMLAGYKPGVLGSALSDCAEKSGKKTDLVVFDACQTATLEALAPLAEGAKFALVSQLPVGKAGLPWHSILGNLGNFEGSAKELAQGIVERYAGLESLPSLSVIDLENLPKLQEDLEALAPMLSAAERKVMLDQQELNQVRNEGLFKRLQRKLSNLHPGSHSNDLGSMLSSLEKLELAPGVRRQVKKVRESLGEAVVTQASPGLSGLSVEAPSLLFDREVYTEKTGLRSWGGLLAAEQGIVSRTIAPLGSLQVKLSSTLLEGQRRLLFGRPE